jgi:hypothetical protein
MREGEFYLTQHHPTAMSIMIKEIGIDCYWFLPIDDG